MSVTNFDPENPMVIPSDALVVICIEPRLMYIEYADTLIQTELEDESELAIINLAFYLVLQGVSVMLQLKDLDLDEEENLEES